MAKANEYAWFRIIEEGYIPEVAIGEIVGLQIDFGDQYSMYGVVEPCTQTGDSLGGETRVAWMAGVEDTGEIIRVSKDAEIVKSLPNGEVDLNPEAKSEADLIDKPKVIKAGTARNKV